MNRLLSLARRTASVRRPSVAVRAFGTKGPSDPIYRRPLEAPLTEQVCVLSVFVCLFFIYIYIYCFVLFVVLLFYDVLDSSFFSSICILTFFLYTR